MGGFDLHIETVFLCDAVPLFDSEANWYATARHFDIGDVGFGEEFCRLGDEAGLRLHAGHIGLAEENEQVGRFFGVGRPGEQQGNCFSTPASLGARQAGLEGGTCPFMGSIWPETGTFFKPKIDFVEQSPSAKG